MDSQSGQPDERPKSDQRTAEPPSASLSFDALARGGREVLIEYRGQLYRLRATRNGKLILNK